MFVIFKGQREGGGGRGGEGGGERGRERGRERERERTLSNVRYITFLCNLIKKIKFFLFYQNFILFYFSILFYLMIQIVSCADLVKGCSTVSRLRHGMSQKVRGTLSGVWHLRCRKSSNLSSGGGRDRRRRTKRWGYL